MSRDEIKCLESTKIYFKSLLGLKGSHFFTSQILICLNLDEVFCTYRGRDFFICISLGPGPYYCPVNYCSIWNVPCSRFCESSSRGHDSDKRTCRWHREGSGKCVNKIYKLNKVKS